MHKKVELEMACGGAIQLVKPYPPYHKYCNNTLGRYVALLCGLTLYMPPFCQAISARVFPRMSLWSLPIEVIALTRGLLGQMNGGKEAGKEGGLEGRDV